MNHSSAYIGRCPGDHYGDVQDDHCDYHENGFDRASIRICGKQTRTCLFSLDIEKGKEGEEQNDDDDHNDDHCFWVR